MMNRSVLSMMALAILAVASHAQVVAPALAANVNLGVGGNTGFAIESIGADLNMDGAPELIIGNPGAPGGGRVTIVSYPQGVAFSAGIALSAIAPGVLPNAQFGWDLACDMDLDGDGINDLVVGSPGLNGNTGSVTAFSVTAGGTVTVLWFRSGVNLGGQFGFSVALMPDTNNDGTPDVAVGEPTNIAGGTAYVLSGANGTVLASRLLGQQAGFSIASGPGCNLNNDNIGDMIVGDPLSDVAYCLDGSTLATISLATTTLGSRFGAAVDYVNDVTGDGFPEVAIGAPIHCSGSCLGVPPTAPRGSVFIADSQSGAVINKIPAPPAVLAGGQFGFSLARLPDSNGNGSSDLVVGAPTGNAPNGGIAVTVDSQTALPFLINTPGFAGDSLGFAVADATNVKLPTVTTPASTFAVGLPTIGTGLVVIF